MNFSFSNLQKKHDTEWVKLEKKFNDNFYKTYEAKRIANNIIFFQNKYGGWGKNIHMDMNLSAVDKLYLRIHYKNLWKSTIDNRATTTEIDYLSKMYNVHHNDKYKKAVKKGINYLLNMQMSNGGFPQCYPWINREYQKQITFNDRAFIEVMILFKNILDKKPQYEFLQDDQKLINNIKEAYIKGLDCILKTQMECGMWCAQYDKNTLTPCSGRIFEPPSIDTRESADIIIFLMSIENPSQDIKNAINKSILWFNKFKNNNNPIARMYDIATQEPIFTDYPVYSGNLAVIKKSLSELKPYTRNKYDYYTYNVSDALSKYNEWKNLYFNQY